MSENPVYIETREQLDAYFDKYPIESEDDPDKMSMKMKDVLPAVGLRFTGPGLRLTPEMQNILVDRDYVLKLLFQAQARSLDRIDEIANRIPLRATRWVFKRIFRKAA